MKVFKIVLFYENYVDDVYLKFCFAILLYLLIHPGIDLNYYKKLDLISSLVRFIVLSLYSFVLYLVEWPSTITILISTSLLLIDLQCLLEVEVPSEVKCYVTSFVLLLVLILCMFPLNLSLNEFPIEPLTNQL